MKTADTGAIGAPADPPGRAPLVGLAWRESRTTRRRLFLYMSSISLGVAALVGIDSFAGNINASVREQARALVGGDVTFSSRGRWKPGADSLFGALMEKGVAIARVTTFGSMALVERSATTRLAQVRAISPTFPLYGQVVTTPAGAWRRLHAGRNAVVDPGLLIALNARFGDSVSLGYEHFEIVGSIGAMPGNPSVSSVIGPRIFIPERYVDSTRLLIVGSRASYEAYAKVEHQAPENFVASRRILRKSPRGGTQPMFPTIGSTMTHAISLRRPLNSFINGAGSLNGRTVVSSARLAGTPGLSGNPSVATPEPALTRRLSP